MKIKFRHRIASMTLAIMMTAAPVWGTALATDEGIGEQPDKPVAESYEDNDKIEEYNTKVDEYNKSAEEYNETVDREYEEAVKEVEEKNAEIDQHNAAEIERVEAAKERNAQAEKTAEEANAKIDEENAAEEARVTEYNNNEDSKAEASAAARKEAEEKNEAIKAHNAAVEKYAEDKVKYDAESEKYQKDLDMEKKIKAAGYASVQQYNDMIETYYNAPARAAAEGNASAKTVSAKDTYTVEEAAEKSGSKVSVHIEHVFEGTSVSYVEDFEIDRNDVISINSIAALGNATQPGYASLYYNTDDAHTTGYWVPYVEVQYNARYFNSDWNCGSSYEISYKDGTNHANDSEDIIAIYNYTWISQKIYKTYNTPVKPADLENPGEAMELVEVPEIYTPVYQEFVKKQHIEAEIEDIEDANILEHIASPVKKDYIALLSRMALFAAPEMAEEAVPAEETAGPVQTADAADPADPAAPATAAEDPAPTAKAAESVQAAAILMDEAVPAVQTTRETPAEHAVPAATAAVENEQAAPAAATADAADAEEAATALVDDQKVPMAGAMAERASWALLNLIMTIVTGILSAILLAGYLNKKDDEDVSEDEKRRRGTTGLASSIAAISAVIIFILTEDMSLRMALTDSWTIIMAVILLIQAGIALIAGKSGESNEEVAASVNA